MSDLIPEGNYTCKAIEASFGVSSQAGTRFLAVTAEITQGKFAGRTGVWHGWFNTEENSDKAMKSLVLTGWDCVDPLAIGPANGVGSIEFSASFEIEPGRPKFNEDGSETLNEDGTPAFYASRNRIAWINDPNATTIGRKLDAGEAAAMGDNLRKLMALKSYKPISKGAAAGAAPGATAPKAYGNGAGGYGGANGGVSLPVPPQTAAGKPLPI